YQTSSEGISAISSYLESASSPKISTLNFFNSEISFFKKASLLGRFLSISTLSKALQAEILAVLALIITSKAISKSASLFTYTKLLPRPLTITAQVACCFTKAIRRSPPRGTIKSTGCVGFSKNAWVSFLLNCKYSTQSLEAPILANALCHNSTIFKFDFKDSFPPFNNILLPDLKAIPAASTVTSGRDS